MGKNKTTRAAGTPATPRRRRRGRPRRGTLALIAGLLMASAGLRVALHSDQVFALDSTPSEAPLQASMASADAGMSCEQPPEIEAMLEAFDAREARLNQREAQVRDRMNALAIADEEIDKKLAQLETAEAALKATLALADNAAENDITQLTAVYENMKPKDAAALFEQMAPEFSAGFLGRMRPEAAAQVMAGLSAERAYAISVILAGRNSSVPKE
ncbi:Flagellar motility protein MotE, a chaperone for MotC folding [Pseudooceanicola antarcticus]|uniref:Flagellar motility protein MotE, a chaperone for MotC folding n=1 Tax=Pseudooceanicola antarcticus TaxID=1247613 RepID=A0A285HWI1_9RHOB|nr:hypothetical protein [Pseudooceanicola antarcticus]PJE27396.1 hypothetical protein CVM39_12435 [Pseudooceanicola antarcticus]SNY40007.1 Flagellar motility protein MotE, a chaperone for MotC folding [Pseudooceanicola antarcticus]